MIKVTMLRYYFKFCYTDLSGQYWEYPVTIATLDAKDADKDAYRRALMSFASSLIFRLSFEAPERLEIKMRKEIVKEMISDDLQGD